MTEQAKHEPTVAEGWHWWRTPWGTQVIRYRYADRDEWGDGLTPDMIAQGWVYRCQALPPEDASDGR
jgi:hypothetical protein